MVRLRTALAALLAIGLAGPSSAIDTTARSAMVLDNATGTILLSKNADQPEPPASMSKLMTLYMVFQALEDGRLSLTDEFRVSTKAAAMGGSKMFVREGEQVSVENLIRGIIVHSGNDACVVIAEGLAGSESAFANQMTQAAREMGMMESTFANATGWPHPEHRMSARDLMVLASNLIDGFPQYYGYFGETEFTWDDITQDNRNPLLALDIGADGLKTGHTEEAGYGLVGSVEQGERRVSVVVTGLDSTRARLVESEKLINWAFREFFSRTLFEADQPIATADVWLGEVDEVSLVSPVPLVALIPYAERDKVEVRVVYDGPLEAPVSANRQLAELIVTIPSIGETRYPLHAASDVARGGFLTRVDASARILLTRLLTYGASAAE